MENLNLHHGIEKNLSNVYHDSFDYFLNPIEKANTYAEREALYVSDSEVEDAFSSIKKSVHNSINFFVGFAGSGKTTTLRYYFRLANILPIIDEEEGVIICPSFFDGYTEKINISQDLATRIGAMCTTIEKKYPQIVEDFYSENGITEFFDFINETKPEILCQNNFLELIDLNPFEQIKKRLNDAHRNFQHSYEASRLKYYILKYCPLIKRMIIILDDIETLSYESQCNYVRDYLSFYTCMTNLPIGSRKLNTNIIISLRPHTYRLLVHNQIIEAYPIAKEIHKKPIDIRQYFTKLYEFKKNSDTSANLEKLKVCYNTLMELCNKFGGKYCKMIVNLTHYNVRKTLDAFYMIINNRTWITKNQYLYLGDSSNNPPNYLFNNITVIRALACGDYKLYFNDEHSLIPNILLSTYNKNYSILCLLILNYFKSKQHSDTLFGIDSEKLMYQNIILTISKLFKNSDLINIDDIEKCIQYLYQKKVLRKSIYDEDVPPDINCSEKLKKHSILYLSSRGYELLDMFENDSVLMELYREDMYRNYNKKSNCEPSYILMITNQQEKIFLDLLRIVGDLVHIEISYRNIAKSNKTFGLYIELFGSNSVCWPLINGIKKSIDYSNKYTDNIRSVYNNVVEVIKNIDYM